MGAGTHALRESRCEMTRERKGERDGEKRARIVEITRMASCGANNHLIRHNISSHRINSKIAIVRERYICIYIFFSFSETVAVVYFLRRSNYCGFIAGINCARRLFGRLKLTLAIYLEHCMLNRFNCRYWKYSF